MEVREFFLREKHFLEKAVRDDCSVILSDSTKKIVVKKI